VLLVVAADDGAMPQTIEHLEVLRLVGIPRLAIALTKTDRVPPARTAEVAAALAALTARAGYTAPIHPVCAPTGAGLRELWAWIDATVPPPPPAAAGFRMAIDRGFILPGIGTVVTGTVIAGEVAPGDQLLLSPARLAARVRSLRVQNRPAEHARAGDRCALAIAGTRVERARLHRGDWLIDPALHAPTTALDVHLRPAEGRLLRHATQVHLHLATAAQPARLRLWDDAATDESGVGQGAGQGAGQGVGQGGFARLQLAAAIPALHGDRLVLRDATGRVVAGGHVVDPFPPQRRRPRPQRLAELSVLAAPDPADALAGLLAHQGAADLTSLARARNVAAATLEAAPAARDSLILGPPARRIAVSATHRAATRANMLAALARHHAAHPDLPGPGRAILLAAAGTEPAIAEALLAALVAEAAILPSGMALRLPAHTPRLAPADAALWPRLAGLLADSGLRPPRVREIAETLTMTPEAAEALLLRCERFGLVLRVAPNRFFLPHTVAALARVAAAIAAEDGFSAADYARHTAIGRNLAIEVLEHLDHLGLTRRTGELRHMLRDPDEILPAEPAEIATVQ
jgi:selenocysteine-specific elongation factor